MPVQHPETCLSRLADSLQPTLEHTLSQLRTVYANAPTQPAVVRELPLRDGADGLARQTGEQLSMCLCRATDLLLLLLSE